MAEVVTSVVSTIVGRIWDIIAKRTPCICDLEDNIDSLGHKVTELKALRSDLKTKIDVEEGNYKKRTEQVDFWLHTAEVLESEVDEILVLGRMEIQKNCLGSCCPVNCWSTCNLAKRVTEKLDATSIHLNKGCFDIVTVDLRFPNVDQRPLGNIVGSDLMFGKVWICLHDPAVGSIGLWGYGGVGKTTLLTKVHNHLAKSDHDFDELLWIVVSKDGDPERVQCAIMKILKLSAEEPQEKAVLIFNVLSTRRFK